MGDQPYNTEIADTHTLCGIRTRDLPTVWSHGSAVSLYPLCMVHGAVIIAPLSFSAL
jgi:hypothetical protein